MPVLDPKVLKIKNIVPWDDRKLETKKHLENFKKHRNFIIAVSK